MLKNLYVPKKSNENKKEEAATCDTTWQAAVALSLSLSLSSSLSHHKPTLILRPLPQYPLPNFFLIFLSFFSLKSH
jgi:hypothetical protein